MLGGGNGPAVEVLEGQGWKPTEDMRPELKPKRRRDLKPDDGKTDRKTDGRQMDGKTDKQKNRLTFQN